MRIALIADTFPPLRTSGAVQLRDLSRELVLQGHAVTVMIPAPGLKSPWVVEDLEGVEVLRLRAPQTKGVGYVRRTLAEFFMPFAMRRNLRKAPASSVRWDGVVWYAPSIFLSPLANALKKASRCRAYLIIRDIFPEWAVDMGIMPRGIPYWFFRGVAAYQYSVADVIGVQTQGNNHYFTEWARRPRRQLEVLQNWLAEASDVGCSIRLANTILAGRKVFVYAGNMGVAQGMDIMLDLAQALQARPDVGFLFVGRGSDAARLAKESASRKLANVMFHDEIDPDEIRGLYAQCHVGLVALDPRHKTHNIPGKFLTYMQSGLPVLANINAGNDLADLIGRERVGRACVSNSSAALQGLAEDLLREIAADAGITARCRSLYARLFSPRNAAQQIVKALAGTRPELLAANESQHARESLQR